jgi:hypothetical protein
MHARTHARAHARKHMLTHSHTYMHTHYFPRAPSHAHLLTHTRTQTLTHTHTHTHIHTHTLFHAPPQVVRESGTYLKGLWDRLNGGGARGGRRLPAGLPLPASSKKEVERIISELGRELESLEKRLQEASKARESKLRKVGGHAGTLPGPWGAGRSQVVGVLLLSRRSSSRRGARSALGTLPAFRTGASPPLARATGAHVALGGAPLIPLAPHQVSIPPSSPLRAPFPSPHPPTQAGLAGRVALASQLKLMDAEVITLSRLLAVRTLQLEMEHVYRSLEDEALDIAAEQLRGRGGWRGCFGGGGVPAGGQGRLQGCGGGGCDVFGRLLSWERRRPRRRRQQQGRPPRC